MEAFGTISGGFGKPKLKEKPIFGTFIFEACFECVLVSILDCFLEARNFKHRENHRFFFVFCEFSQNRCFQEVRNASRFWINFRGRKRRTTYKKLCLKTYNFGTSIFMRLLPKFGHFVSILETPGASPNRKKTKKFAFGSHLGFQYNFRNDFGSVWEILDGFCTLLKPYSCF